MTINLTNKQRESVEYDSGDLLIRGVPGSGKSVVVMQRAFRINKDAIRDKQKKKILILSYTKSLVKYMKDLVDLYDLSENMIEISTVDKCCHSLFLKNIGWRFVSILDAKKRKEYVEQAIQNHLSKSESRHRFHDIDSDFWMEEFKWIKEKDLNTSIEYTGSERIGRGSKIRMSEDDKNISFELFSEYEKLRKMSNRFEWEDLYKYFIDKGEIPEEDRYDYVLVDEAQDLALVKLKFAKMLARDSVTIAADRAQKIYKTTFSWSDIGIDVRGRGSKKLEKSFRSTKEIVNLAESLLEVNRILFGDKSEYTSPVIPESTGKIPTVIYCKDAASEQDTVQKFINEHLDEGDVIGVLYRSRKELNKIRNWINAMGINFELIKGDVGWSLTTPGVKLSTLHSAKGLEFDVVIIPFFNETVLPISHILEGADEEQIEEIKSQERSLLYVGMTRARLNLYITYTGSPSCYLYDFEPDLYEYKSSEGEQIKKPERNRFSESKDQPDNILEAENQSENLSDKVIQDGATVHVLEKREKRIKKFIIDSLKYSSQKPAIGKRVGEEFEMRGEMYVVKDIL